jgi:hypothetical protein
VRDAIVATVDGSSRESVNAPVDEAPAPGDDTGLIHAAGVSPLHAPPEAFLKVDLYSTAHVLEEFATPSPQVVRAS